MCTYGAADDDVDIKISNATCTVIAYIDGGGCGNYIPTEWSWTCATAGTYFVEVADYASPVGNHNCDPTSTTTFTLFYYKVEAPQTGSCCYADGTCEVTDEAHCIGTYTAGGVCEPNTCPLPCAPTQAGQANDFVFNGSFTSGVNNYDVTCLGGGSSYYDNGEEEIFVWTVDVDSWYEVNLTTDDTYNSIIVAYDCEATMCETSTYAGSGIYSITIPCHLYPAGDYFIFIDNWSESPTTFTVAVTECSEPTLGRCCYGSPYAPECVINYEAECLALTNDIDWTEGGECPCEPLCDAPGAVADECINAIPVGVLPAHFAGNNTGMTPVDPAIANDGNASGPAVWYSVVGTGNTLTASTCGACTEFDSFVRVYYCGCDNLTVVGYNDSSCPESGDHGVFSWCSVQDEVYLIAVCGYGTSSTGRFVLDVTDDGVACEGGLFCPVTGACCYNDGANCSTITEEACTLLGGDYYPGEACVADGGDFECPPGCGTFPLCGTPAEAEPNDDCPAPTEQTVIGCDMTVYGLVCQVDDHDFWQVVVPAGYRMTLKAYQGEACDVNPTSTLKTNLYYDDCSLAGGPTTSAWILTNPTVDPWVVYVEVFGTAVSTYKLEAVCCPIVDYLANPIVIDVPSFTYTHTENSCCATNPISTIGGYASGPDVIFTNCNSGTFTFTASGLGDNQIIVFDAAYNILGYADATYGGDDEVLTLTISGCWYVGVSLYGASSCGDITLSIEGDVWLPVELVDFDAIASDGAVTLNWTTASETDNDHFNVVRNGERVGEIAAKGHATGGEYTYTDGSLVNGTTYDYSVVSVSMNGDLEEVFTISATPSFAAATITEYALHQNFPNPFNPETKITFDMVEAGYVNLTVYNLLGQQVAALVNNTMDAGRHIVSFDATNLPSGLYLYRMETSGFSAQKKMVLMK
jgi:hypothetical protein